MDTSGISTERPGAYSPDIRLSLMKRTRLPDPVERSTVLGYRSADRVGDGEKLVRLRYHAEP
jgi:hypothetical protein